MKIKIAILALSFVLAFIVAKAQTVVPNANMELWTHHSGYDDPNFWTTPNPLTGGLGAYEVFKDSTNVFDGNYSARLTCASVFGFIVPGVMTTGKINVDIANQTYSFAGGSPLSDTGVAAMIGYYKYTGVGLDSCLMYCTLTKWNTSTNERDTVATTSFKSGTTAGYTFFASSFTWLIASEKPDTAQIILLTTANYNNAAVGSTLWVDDIDFTNDVGIASVQNNSLQLYPNPADESLLLALPQELHAKTIIVSNVAGTIVKEIRATSSEININTMPFAQGAYVLFVKNTEGNIVASGKFTVKH